MIGHGIARFRMGEDDQAAAIERQPRKKRRKNLWRAGELAGPHGMGSDGTFMHSAPLNIKPGRAGVDDGARRLHRLCVKVDMSVIALDKVG